MVDRTKPATEPVQVVSRAAPMRVGGGGPVAQTGVHQLDQRGAVRLRGKGDLYLCRTGRDTDGDRSQPYVNTSRRGLSTRRYQAGAWSGVHACGRPGLPGNRKSTNACAVGCGSWLARPGRSLASMNT